MTQGSQSLHLSGSKVSTNAPLDVNATNALQHMKQELSKVQAENKKLVDQLNCFISLVQRSWKGDRHATVHLSNIIGLDPPNSMPANDGSQARPNSEMNVKTRSEQNWERLALKLLDREYNAVQQEIREYQQRYIQNRQAYMDAVLQDHQQTMSVIPLSRQPSAHALDNIDSRFITHNKAMQRMGISPSHKRRVQSAKVQSRTSAKDQVKAMDISLKDLVGDVPSSNHFTDKEGDLYDVRDSDGVKKPRPVSASSLREGDEMRSRPHSGSHGRREKGATQTQAFLTQKNERSLRYEATKPVYVYPKQSRPRQNSDGQIAKLSRSNSHPGLISQTDIISASSAPSAPKTSPVGHQSMINEHHGTEIGGGEDSYREMEPVLPSKPPISIRVKSAHIRRPAHIDKFADEERALREMEADFKKTALTLQKKLGLNDTGIIMLD